MNLRRLCLLVAAFALMACGGELSPLASRGADGGPNGDGDGDGDGEPAMTFRPNVQSDLESAGCAAGACHGGGSVPMVLVASPLSDDEWRGNYGQVEARAGSQTSSLLIDKAVGAGGHTASLAADDPIITRWREWISAGAPYEAAVAATDAGVASSGDAGLGDGDAGAAGLTWQRDVDPIMRARCIRCHGSSGAYSVETHSAALGFGRDAIPNVVPGDPGSLLAIYSEQGHQGITPTEALLVIDWIVEAGAAP